MIISNLKVGNDHKYLVPLSKHILVQQNDFVRAGQPLSDGAITPKDILNIEGPTKVQEYIVNEIQEVYRLQGVKINDKHFEVIVRQMMLKHHLSYNYFKVFVINFHPLKSIYLLNLIYNVFLDFCRSFNIQYIFWCYCTIR